MQKILLINKKLRNKLKIQNNGFTLIELLGVIILLAIISLIATPIILNVVNDAQESVDMSTAQLIVNSGHNYYAASLFDEAKKMKIDNLADVYNEIEMTNKPTTGQLYVNSNNQISMAVVINDKCYKKNFIGDVEIISTSECDLGFIGQDEIAPTISQEVINTSANSNDWYKEDLYIQVSVTDNESGVAGYKRCMGTSECTPDNTIYNVSNQIYINTESDSNYVCVIGVDNYGNESDKECVIYKLDKTVPIAGTANFTGTLGTNDWYTTDVTIDVLDGSDNLSGHDSTISNLANITSNTTGTTITITTTDLAGNTSSRDYVIKVDKDSPSLVAQDDVVEITEGDSNEVSNYFNVSYSISGGSISCTPTNTSSLEVGSQMLSCTATGGNSLTTTATKQITVKINLPESISFAEDSWETISELVKAGVAEENYNVGDTKEVVVSGYGTFTVRIANILSPSECTNSNFSQTACGFVVEFVDIITERGMNSTMTSSGGWPASSMHTFVNNTIYNALPSDLRDVIIDTKVYGSSSLISTDKLYLLSAKEVWGKDGTSNTMSDSIDNYTRQLDYYKNLGVTTSRYSGAVKTYNGSNNEWWLRSMSGLANFFYFVETNGKGSNGNANASFGVAPAFRIG